LRNARNIDAAKEPLQSLAACKKYASKTSLQVRIKKGINKFNQALLALKT